MAAMPDRPTVVAITGAGRLVSRPSDGEPLSVTLLGAFALGAGPEIVELPIGMQRLVAVLALRGRMSRSRLAGTLWPDTTEHRALASLRTGIWRLNQVADQLVVCPGGTVDLGQSVLVDVRRLVASATAVLRAGAQASLDDAHAILDDDGELLPGWEDEWLSVDRERLRQLRLHVLEAVAERLALAGCFGLALEAGLAALGADGLRESAHRTLIRIHLAEGNVAEARRAFEHCRDVLIRDVGVEPSAATCDLMPSFSAGAGRVTAGVKSS
jgi:DNA-binding SARP family transcriptional activator